MRILLTCTALFLLLWGQSAVAHSLYLFAQHDGHVVTGKAYYSDMSPAVETYIEVYRQGETEPAVFGKTDKLGAFHLPVEGEGVFKVVIEGAEGHKATTYAANVLGGSNSSNALLVLREDIATMRDKFYFRDILGGLGYIIGIIGLWAWRQSRRLQHK